MTEDRKPSVHDVLNVINRLGVELYRAIAKRGAERTDAIERARKHAAEAVRLLEGM